jgi:hypothetical protein
VNITTEDLIICEILGGIMVIETFLETYSKVSPRVGMSRSNAIFLLFIGVVGSRLPTYTVSDSIVSF